MSGQTHTAGQVNGKSVAKYLLLPEILPRARELGGAGFGYFAFLIACVYQAVRILPANHPYTRPGNIGKFGIRQAIAAAANHVTINRKNIDQIIIFFAVITAVILLVLQFLGLIYLLFSGVAFAQEAADAAATAGPTASDFAGIFKTTQPAKDIAFLLLDHVFGIPDFFGSEAMAEGSTPFHLALQTLFQFYNLAILIVAVIIFLYFVMVVVTETALSGTPFGKRFNSIYAPLRLVFAIGLLVPLNHGLNASQYIVLAAARAGSGMATNGWIIFNRELTNPMGVENASLIGAPKAPDSHIDQFITVMFACKTAYNLITPTSTSDLASLPPLIRPYIRIGEKILEYESTDYKTALEQSKGGEIEIVFGEKGNSPEHQRMGGVIPYCGSINIPLTTRNPALLSGSQSADGAGNAGGATGGSGSQEAVGPEAIQQQYFGMVKWMIGREIDQKVGERFAYALAPNDKQNPCVNAEGNYGTNENIYSATPAAGLGDSGTCDKDSYKPPSSLKESILGTTQSLIDAQIKSAAQKAQSVANFKISDEVLKRGWGGAGIWYNQIAEISGAMVDASYNFPTIKNWPLLMAQVLADKATSDGATNPCNRFDPNVAAEQGQVDMNANQVYVLSAEAATYAWWYCDNTEQEKGMTSNIFWDAMHVIFSTNGLFDLRRGDPDELHPLAAMTLVGKSLVESSIRNMAYSVGTAALGGALGALAPHWGAPLQAMSAFFVSVAMIGLTAGFILFYILPFLPFIYFFFAVGSWIKTIFEAMVGAPLWALAHLRIDGEGFPGRSAANGYFLIFEIFVRPILTLFGLLGGMAVFTAMAVILHDLFDFVIFQVTGTDLENGTSVGGSVYTGEMESFRRSIVDEFFYTILYAILLYMMGLASFKMIDQVPNNILRWMGAGVSSFADQAGDAKEGLVQYAALGGYRIGGDLLGATNKLAGGVGTGVGAALKAAAGGDTPPAQK